MIKHLTVIDSWVFHKLQEMGDQNQKVTSWCQWWDSWEPPSLFNKLANPKNQHWQSWGIIPPVCGSCSTQAVETRGSVKSIIKVLLITAPTELKETFLADNNLEDFQTRRRKVRGRSARGLYLASILRAPAKLEILARYRISFQEILAKPKVGVW
jgi:hypothetical protein